MLLDTPTVATGWQAAQFTLPDADGKPHNLNDMAGENGFVVAFICNHCPYVKNIASRLAADTQMLISEGIGVIAINSNDADYVAEDSPENMKLFAAKHGFVFPYLVDEDQSIAKAYDAVCTPDFFGFNRHHKLQYRGRLDDIRGAQQGDRQAELVSAMRLIASTETGPETQHASMGCSIKWR